MNIITCHTANSTYEIDTALKQVRRMSGVREATSMLGEDGRWRGYEAITVLAGRNLMISWPGTTIATITSTIEDPAVLADLRTAA